MIYMSEETKTVEELQEEIAKLKAELAALKTQTGPAVQEDTDANVMNSLDQSTDRRYRRCACIGDSRFDGQ